MSFQTRKRFRRNSRWLIVVLTKLACVVSSISTVVLVLVSQSLEETSSILQRQMDSNFRDAVHVVTTRCVIQMGKSDVVDTLPTDVGFP